MSNPYTYCLSIELFGTKYYYYGVRWANKIEPKKDLWNVYFSSSKSVNLLIEQYGKNCFKAEVRKIFNSPEEAFKWEHKVLRRIKAIQRKNWLNEANYPEFRDNSGENHPMWKLNRPEHSKKMSGTKHPMYGKTAYDIWLEKYGKEEADILLKECNEKKRISHIGKYLSEIEKIRQAKAQGFNGCWLEHKDGRKVFVENQSAFAREYNLSLGALSEMIHEKRQQHKGWKLL